MQPSVFIKITPEDFDAGFVTFPLRYRRGEPPAGWPDEVRLNVPDQLEVSNTVEEFTRTGDPLVFVRVCLPARWRSEGLFNMLAFDCFNQLLDACYTLCLGEELKNKIITLNLPVPPSETSLGE